MRSSTAWLCLLAGLSALPACGGCDEGDGMDKERVRVWGREKVTETLKARAEQPLDAHALDERPDLKQRILGMGFDEVVARLGFVTYRGKASFALSRNKHNLEVYEDSLIERGLHGSFRVLQKDAEGAVLRETVYNNGVYYARNGAGKLRVQGIRQDETGVTQEQAFEALKSFTAYYGPRLGLSEAGTGSVKGRAAVKYELILLEGSELVEVPGMKGQKKPVSIRGVVLVDEATGVPLQADMDGRLDIPPASPGTETSTATATPGEAAPGWGKLTFHLDFVLETTEGAEVKPGEFVGAISRRPVDLNPTAFLDGGTRTSTVIGGKKGAR